MGENGNPSDLLVRIERIQARTEELTRNVTTLCGQVDDIGQCIQELTASQIKIQQLMVTTNDYYEMIISTNKEIRDVRLEYNSHISDLTSRVEAHNQYFRYVAEVLVGLTIVIGGTLAAVIFGA